MSEVTISARPAEGLTRVLFLSALFICTIGTVVVFPLLGDRLTSAEYQQNSLILLLGWFSTAHVGVTAFYYADRDFIPHILSRKTRYIYAPALVVAASITAWGLTMNTPYFWVFWQVYHAWLLWHFMRQNIGVSALAAQATKAGRLVDRDRLAITLVGVGAMLAAMRFGPSGHPLPLTFLFNLGLAVYLCGLGLGLYRLARRIRSGENEMVAAAFIMASLIFFAPTFLADSYFPAVMAYAIAHALQYWILMSLLAIGSGRISGWARSAGSFIVMVSVMYLFIHLSRQGEMWGTWAAWVAGIGIGITIAHFVIDADSWRMREAFQRNYVMARLGRFIKA